MTTFLLVRSARASVTALLRFVYPPCCAGCGCALGHGGDPVCRGCLRRLERPQAAAVAHRLGRLPDSARAALDGAFALWHFDTDGAVQRIHHRLKYGNRPRLGVSLGSLLGAAYAEAAPSRADAVVPVPLHRARYYERGYNQSAMLARGAGRSLALPVDERALVRTRATPSQTRLARTRRWANVSGAFAVSPRVDVTGRTFVLVDDVLTTGATLAAAATALRGAGAGAVFALTLSLAR